MSIRVTLFEDNQALNRALSQLIESSDSLVLAGAFSNCSNVLQDIVATSPQVVLMDIEMPEVNGIEGVRTIRKHFPNLKIIMQTVFDNDERIFEALLAGASGYLLKSIKPEEILSAIHDVHDGGAPMSPAVATKVIKMFQSHTRMPDNTTPASDYQLSKREKDVLRCMSEGKPYKIICDELNISYNTVRTHVQSIYDKLHVHGMTEAVAKAIQERLF